MSNPYQTQRYLKKFLKNQDTWILFGEKYLLHHGIPLKVVKDALRKIDDSNIIETILKPYPGWKVRLFLEGEEIVTKILLYHDRWHVMILPVREDVKKL